jgi:dipeptidyl aminopeptidase/acylaminoacyl peptidase
VCLTKGEGAKEGVRYRVVQLGRGGSGGRGGGGQRGGGPQEPIDLAKPLLLSAFGEWTKKSGYSELQAAQSPSSLLWLDKSVGAPTAAKNADRLIFAAQTFNEYPNYWVADKRMASPRQVTDAMPEIFKEFAWGSKKLIDYKNSKGVRLQGTLTLPAGYEAGKKYPMIVYFYELMSDTHHNFSIPVYDDRPHMSTYASNGYLVLQPDVRYVIGQPGTSALDCVTSAVKKVIELGYADPARIGLQGHSWGGYQSSFIVTQTDMFAAVVTGAPPTNLTSFVGTLYRSTGTLQQGITEVGQVRMGTGATPWSSKELYESQSPVHNAPKIKTPFMILHGTADGSVDYGQGLEFYAAARRLGKPVILLSYPDEAHHLGRKENQKDFQVRMRQFFDHYLKGTPAPLWMTEGVPQLRKGQDPTIVAPPPKKTE